MKSIKYQGTDIDWSTVGGGSWNSNKTGGVQKTCVEINGQVFYRVMNLPMEINGIKERLKNVEKLIGQLSAQDALRTVFLWDLKNYGG